MNDERQRLFAGVWFPNEINETVLRVKSLLEEKVAERIRFVKPENVHMTLKFMGEVKVCGLEKLFTRLENISRDFTPMRFVASGVGAFPNKRKAKVIWLGLEGDNAELSSLAVQIDRASRAAFKTDIEKRRMKPHITIGRLKNGADILEQMESLESEIPKISFSVDRFYVVKSVLKPSGPEYEMIREFILGYQG